MYYIKKDYKSIFKNPSPGWVAQVVECHPMLQEVVDLIPDQGIYLVWKFNPWYEHIRETTNPCFSDTPIFLFLSLPSSLSLKSIKKTCPWVRIKVKTFQNISWQRTKAVENLMLQSLTTCNTFKWKENSHIHVAQVSKANNYFRVWYELWKFKEGMWWKKEKGCWNSLFIKILWISNENVVPLHKSVKMRKTINTCLMLI